MRTILRASVNLLPYGLRQRIKNIPGIAALQRWLVRRVLGGHPFVHVINAGPAAGLQFEVELPLDKAIWAGTYETDFAGAIAKGVKQGDVCYDVGGYRGYMSGVMALAGASKVLVFEPLPANQRALRRLIDLNPELPIELISAAVGDIDGSMHLKVMPDPSMSKLASSPFQIGAVSVTTIEVGTRRIDTLVENGEIPPPNVIKIDVEGAEVCALQGAADVLRGYRPLIFLEAHTAALEKACSRELSGLGYELRRNHANVSDDEQTRHLVYVPG